MEALRQLDGVSLLDGCGFGNRCAHDRLAVLSFTLNDSATMHDTYDFLLYTDAIQCKASIGLPMHVFDAIAAFFQSRLLAQVISI